MDRFRKSLSDSLIARVMSYCLMLQLIFPPLWINNVYAALVTDPHASVSFQPQIDHSSAVPIINIAAPNSTGLSHNKYQSFDVDANGLVFNNSLVSGNSRLAGQIVANPLFGGRTASIILNEVTGTSDSELKGLMEVFGDQANTIIANPNGITCNGCGFINTQRGTLTTGAPDLSLGKLRFDIEGGLIRFEGEGYSYRSFVDEMDVLSRYIDVNGDISTKDRLSLVAGRFVFDYSKSMAGGSLPEWVDAKQNTNQKQDPNRTLAIDGSIFGAMQSGQIDIMGTEQGLGVKTDGYLFAQADDLFIQSAGGLAINNADAVREIKLSAQDDIVIGADLIANLAIKAEGKSLSTSEETNLIANDVELNAEENLNLKGEVKALAIAIEAGSIAIEADILAVNSVAFKASKDARFKDSMVGSNKSDIDSIELVTLATEFNIKDFSITAEKTTIEDTTIEVNELNFELGKVDSNNFKLLADSANISYESWNDNNSQWNIGTLELIGKQLSTQNGNWLFNTGNIHATDLTLRESALFSYIADVQAVNLSANESTIYTEKLLLAVAQSLSSIGDRWKILPFSTQSETAAAGTFLLSAAETEFTGSVIQADNFSLTGADSEFNHTEILANTIKLEGQYLSTNEDTLWIANDSINLVTTTADLNNTIKTSSIKIAAENAEVSGHWLISENANISSNQSLNLEALELTANSFVASFEDGAWDDLLVKTNNSDITANNLLISQGTIESTQLSVSANALTLDENTWLGAHDAIIAADQLNNSGTLLAADELQLNTRKINNQGDIASFAQVNINSSETLNNHGKIISSQLVIDSANITNTNSISSDKLALDYQTIQNTESANLASNNAIYTAKTNTASFTNYGTQIASDSMQWLTAETSSGSYTNAGLLTGTNINFSGLNNVQNGQLIDGNIKGTIHALTNSDAEAIANEGTITIGAEEFTQLGTIKANQLNITRNDFHNEGAIYSHQFNVDTTEKFTNSGVIGAQTIDIKTELLTNNASSTLSATNTNISNADIINAGELISNKFNVTGNAVGDTTFINTDSGIFVQNSDIETLEDGSTQVTSLGNTIILGFDKFTNSGLIETDGLLSIRNIKTFNNLEDDLSDLDKSARIVSNSGIQLSTIDAINNEAVLVSDALAIDAYSINNSGIIGAGEASINIIKGDAKTGKLTNSGNIYQSDLIATQATRELLATTQNEFNIATTDLDNLASASIEIEQGSINLHNGGLKNLGLISEIKDDNNNTNLQLTGIKNLENSNDIYLTTDLHIADNGSFKNLGENSYINAKAITGGSDNNHLTESKNEGVLLVEGAISIYADSMNNSNKAKILANSVALNIKEGFNNEGMVGADKDLNIIAKNIVNTQLAELYSAEEHVSIASSSSLNNAGRILAKKNINLESILIVNDGLTSAEKSLLVNQATAGSLTNDGLMIGDTLHIGHDNFRQKIIKNSGQQSEETDGSIRHKGLQSSSGNVQLITEALANSGSIISAHDLIINATTDMTAENAMSGQLEAAEKLSLKGTSLTVTNTGRINASGNGHRIDLTQSLHNDGSVALANSAAINAVEITNGKIIQSDNLKLTATSGINNQGADSKIFANTLALTGDSILNGGLIHGNESVLLKAMRAVNNDANAKLTSLGILKIKSNSSTDNELSINNAGIINTNGLSIDSKTLINQNAATVAAGEARLSVNNIVNKGIIYQTDDVISAEDRALLTSSEGDFNITTNTIKNQGLQSFIDIKDGVIDVSELTNEGSIRARETDVNSASLKLTNIKALENSGEIVLYTDLLLNDTNIKNTGSDAYLRAKSITANNITSFENDGKIAAYNNLSMNSKNDFINSGEIVADDLQISSEKNITNNKLIQAENTISLNASEIRNTSAGEISTIATDSQLLLDGALAIANDGLIASKGDIRANTKILTNNKNISASKSTTLNVRSLGNSGLIYGASLIVGSAENKFNSIAQPSGIRSFSSTEQKGLIASNSLTLYSQGILDDIYQATNINIISTSDLTLNGRIIADNQANITSTAFTNNGRVDIGESALTSTWNIQGKLDNKGILNSNANLLLNANITSNSGTLHTSKALMINSGNFTNEGAGDLSTKGRLTISGIGASLTDRSIDFTNNGEIVADQGFDLSAKTITNNNNIKATGNSQWYFNDLVNSQDTRISVDGDWKLGSISQKSGSINNTGKLYGKYIEFYGSALENGSDWQAKNKPKEERAQLVAYDGNLNIDTTSNINNYGSLYARNAFNLKTTSTINNNGVIESFLIGNNTLIANTINNGNGINITGEIKTTGNLTIESDVLNNKSYGIGSIKLYEEVVSYRWDKTGCISCDTKSATFYTYLDYRYGTYKEHIGSNIKVGKSLIGKGGVWNNSSSTILAEYLNVTKLNKINNESAVIDMHDVSLHWKKKLKNKKKSKHPARNKLNSYYGNNDVIISEVYKENDQFYWNEIPQNDDGTQFLSSKESEGIVNLPGSAALIRAQKMDVGKHTKILNLGTIDIGIIQTKDEDDDSSAADVTVLNGNNSDGTSTSNNSGAIGSAAGEVNVGDNTANQNTNVSTAEAGESELTEDLDGSNDHIKGSFINGADGIVINVANREPSATISLLSFAIPGLSFEALNAASVAGDKTAEELAAQAALQAQLDLLESDKDKNSDTIKGQSNSYNSQAPSLFDLDEDILARIIADTEYELSPEYIFDKVDPDKTLDTEPKFFLDPYQEAQAVTQAALQQTGSAFFSPDWNTSAEQRQGLYDNTLVYLEQQQGITLGKALTPMQVKQLEQPMIWYVSMNIAGQSQLVPTVYLPEATLDQITTPSAGTIIADSIDINVGDFKNTGDIQVANSARIQADVITNQRNVMTFGDDSNYGAIAGTGGNISAGNLALISQTDINNNGGSLTTKDSLTLNAQGDINLNALELKKRSQHGKNITESTDYLLSQINVGGDATFQAGGDINSQAAQAKIGGNGIFDATNINLLGVTERDYSKTVSKKKGLTSSSKKTIEQEKLNFIGSDFQVGGNMLMNAKNDITMVGANVDVGKSAAIKAGNDITVTAGISTDTYSKNKSGSGIATTSSQQKGHVKQTATGSMIKTGESLQIDSDGGNVAILASELDAKKNLVFGDMTVKVDENGNKMVDENGQYITEDGSSINNLTIGTVALKDEDWNVKSSGLKGPLKDLAGAAAFALSATALGQVAMAAGLDTEIEVGKTSESRVESTTHVTSTISAGDTLVVRADGDFRIEGSQVNATDASIETNSTVITAVENTTTTTESSSTHTVGATKATLKKDEVTVAGSSETKQSETTTTTDSELVKAGLNVSGNLAMNSVENIDVLASDVNVDGNSTAKAKTITVAGLAETTTTEHKEKTETTTTSIGVKNAYVDTAYAVQAVADAGAAVDAAKSALEQAKRDVKNGTLQANAIADYEANLAAATTQLTQATLSVAASAATAAGTTGTGGFYASGSAEKTIVEKTSTNTEQRYIGSSFNVGGDASFNATDSIDIVGSSMDIAGGLALNATDVTIKAGTEETTSTSSETTRTAGVTASYGSGGSDAFSGGINASGSNTDSDSYSKTHINSTINAGSLTSTSDNLTLSGANVEVAGNIDIDTGNLVIESLQDESSSSSKTEGYSIGAGVSASSMDPSSIGANENASNSDSQWVNNQTSLIGGTSGEGEVNISADKTTITGAVVASATRNEDGTLTDNGNLTLATDELVINNLQDKDHSENTGFDVSAGVSSSGSTTVGLTNNGHKKEQDTLATLGGGSITQKDGSAHEEGLVESANSDLNNSQVITKDQQTGGLDATVTIDHRLVTDEGRTAIQKDIVDTTQHALEIGKAVEDVVTTDLNATEVFSQVNKYATDREVLAQQAADKAQQEKLRGEEGAEGSEDGLQNLSDALTEVQGLEEGVDVALFDGSQLQDDTLAIDSTSVNKTEVEGAYHENGGDVYVNIDNTDMTNSVDTVSTLVHEQARHEMAQNGETGSLSRDDQTTLATNRGDRAGDVWEAYSGLNGASTQGSGNQQTWNAANQNSANVQQGTQSIAKVNNNELKARQLERNEASLLDQAKNNIANNESLTAEQKAQETKDLTALACASVECASGVSVNDPLYAELSALQAEGESLIASGEDIESTLGVHGVNTSESGEDFTYSALDEAGDVIDANEKLVTKVGGVIQTTAGVAGTLGGVGVTITGAAACAPTAGGGCAVAAAGIGLTGLSAAETAEGFDKVTSDYEYESGQRVKDSFSTETHQGEHEPLVDLGVDGAVAAVTTVGAKVGLPVIADKAGELYDVVKGKLGGDANVDSNPVDNSMADGIDGKPDYYVGQNGPEDTLPATGYRYDRYLNDDGTENKWGQQILETNQGQATYIGFDKLETGKEVRDAFQIKGPEHVNPDNPKDSSWSDGRLRSEFDTLQLFVDGKPNAVVPNRLGNSPGQPPEPITEAYPEFGEGGHSQLYLDRETVKYDETEILPEGE